MAEKDSFDRFVADEAENTQYESHYLKANSPDGERAFWVKHTLVCAGPTWAERIWEVWFLAFERGGRTWVNKAELRWGQMEAILDGPCLVGPGVRFDPTRSVGKLGSIEWELILGGGVGPIRHLPIEALYRGRNTKVLTPASCLRFAGEVRLGDETWPIDSWVGCRGHNWGEDYGQRYGWVATHVWDDGAQRSVEGFTGLASAPLVGQTLVSRVIAKGADTASWTRPGTWPAAPGAHAVRFQSSGGGSLSAEAAAGEFVHLRYRSPSGADVLCRCTKFASVRFEGPSGVSTSRCGELEFVDRALAVPEDALPPADWKMSEDGVFERVFYGSTARSAS
ncbi:MAG TPA: hypothetical protein QGF58_04990 [Myxococcota bacterium]|nr:hypothetical protein [Myxococcota bacterium]